MAESKQVMTEKSAMTVAGSPQAQLDADCEELVAAVQKARLDITGIQALLSGNPTAAQLQGVLTSIDGISADIEEDVKPVREAGGNGAAPLVCSDACKAAFTEAASLQATLAALKSEVNGKLP